MGRETSDKDTFQSKIPLYLSIGFLAAVIASYFLIPGVGDFFNKAWDVLTSDDETRIKEWIDGFGWLGPIVLILAMIFQMFLIIVPTILLMVVCVLAYGPIWGSLIIFIAVFTASSVGYAIGKYLGEFTVQKLIGTKTKHKVSDFLKKYGFWAIVVTRINPFLSNDAISFVGGMLKMSYWKFISATIIGISPLIVFIAIIGRDTQRLQTGLLWGSVGSLALFLIYIWWNKRQKQNER